MEPEGSFRVQNSLPSVPIVSRISRMHTVSHSIPLRYNLISFPSLQLRIPVGVFPSGFPQPKLCVCFFSPPLVPHHSTYTIYKFWGYKMVLSPRTVVT